MTLRVTGGEKRVLPAGTIAFVEESGSKGHSTRVIGDETSILMVTEVNRARGRSLGEPDREPGKPNPLKEGAYGDLLLAEGNPLDDIKVVGDLDNLLIIMKDGKIYKNILR